MCMRHHICLQLLRWSGYSGYPLYWFSLATDCRWRRRQLDLQLVVSRICGSDGRALGMMERRLSSIDGANLTNLDTLRYDRPCLRSLVAASPRSVPCSLAPFAGTPLCSPFDLRLSPVLPHLDCVVDLSALATLHLFCRLVFTSHFLACYRTLQQILTCDSRKFLHTTSARPTSTRHA